MPPLVVAENVEEAVVSRNWVARNAGGNGCVQATLRLVVGKEQVIEVGLAFPHNIQLFSNDMVSIIKSTAPKIIRGCS